MASKGTQQRYLSADRLSDRSFQGADLSEVVSALLAVLSPDDLLRRLAVYAEHTHTHTHTHSLSLSLLGANGPLPQAES